MTLDEEWDYWVEKSVYSLLFDKVFEVTSLEWDKWDRPILYCEEKIAEDIYDKPQWFNIFEVREL
jgi:hypothetical protein